MNKAILAYKGRQDDTRPDQACQDRLNANRDYAAFEDSRALGAMASSSSLNPSSKAR